MSTNLKFKTEIASDVDSLRSHLLDFSAYSKISALNLIDYSNVEILLDEIKICAYDFRPSVRLNAYYALQFSKPEKITEILKDALRDEDADAFKAARKLSESFSKK